MGENEVETVDQTGADDAVSDVLAEDLIEEVSIDGMCGVY